MRNKSPRYDAPIDSDVLVDLIWTGERLHIETKPLFGQAKGQHLRLVTTCLMKQTK